MRGTRIRWDGALKAIAFGLTALAALLVLPGLLGEEPPPPPGDVGLLTAPATPPAAPASAPPTASKRPRAPEREPGEGEGRPKRRQRRGVGRRESDGRVGRDRVRRERADAGAEPPEVAATATYAPPATIRERFGFER